MSAKDANGSYYLYFSTGDGDFDLDQSQAPNTDAADSFVKLNPTLNLNLTTPHPAYFTPADQYWRGCGPPNFNDKDFGSGGSLAIPESTFSPPQFFAVKPDKENYLWVMDRTSPGGYTGGVNDMNKNCGPLYQSCTVRCTAANNNVESFLFSTIPQQEARSTPAFWGGTVASSDQGELYLAGTYDQLKRYPISTTCNPGPVCTTAAATTNVDPTGTPASPAESSGRLSVHAWSAHQRSFTPSRRTT